MQSKFWVTGDPMLYRTAGITIGNGQSQLPIGPRLTWSAKDAITEERKDFPERRVPRESVERESVERIRKKSEKNLEIESKSDSPKPLATIPENISTLLTKITDNFYWGEMVNSNPEFSEWASTKEGQALFTKLYKVEKRTPDGSVMTYLDGQSHSFDDEPAILTAPSKYGVVEKWWFKEGQIHRGNGEPAHIKEKKGGETLKIWIQKDRIYREGDEPAVTCGDEQIYFHDGVIHRDNDLPAWINPRKGNPDGNRARYSSLVSRRRDGIPTNPRVIFTRKVNDKYEEWYQYGELHRGGNLPAAILGSTVEYFHEGKEYTPAPVIGAKPSQVEFQTLNQIDTGSENKYMITIEEREIEEVVRLVTESGTRRNRFAEVEKDNRTLIVPFSSVWLLRKIYKRVQNLNSGKSSARDQHSNKFAIWTILEKLLKKLDSDLKSLGVLHKYLVATGYLYQTPKEGSQVPPELLSKIKRIMTSEQRFWSEFKGVKGALEEVKLVHAEFQRLAVFRMVKLCEYLVLFLKGCVPELKDHFEAWIESAALVSYNNHLMKDIFQHVEAEVGEEDKPELISQYLTQLFESIELPSKEKSKNYLFGHALLGKLPKVPFNPSHASFKWGMVKQARKPVSQGNDCGVPQRVCGAPLPSCLGRVCTLTFEDLGPSCVHSNSSGTGQLEQLVKESSSHKIENPLRDQRVANNLASLFIMALNKADRALNQSLPDEKSMLPPLPETESKCCNILSIDYVTPYVREFTFLKTSILRLLEDTISPLYVIGLLFENSSIKKLDKLDSNLTDYLKSRKLGSVRAGSIDSDDPDGTASVADHPREEDLEGIEGAKNEGANILEATQLGLDQIREQPSEASPTPDSAVEGEQDNSSNAPTAVVDQPQHVKAHLSFQDKVIADLYALRKDFKLFTPKTLTRAFNLKKRKIFYKLGYIPQTTALGSETMQALVSSKPSLGTSDTTLEVLVDNMLETFETLMKAYEIISNYFETPEGNLQKPAIEQCLENIAIVQLMTKQFRFYYRTFTFLTYTPLTGSPETYKVYQSDRYIDHSLGGVSYYYSKIVPASCANIPNNPRYPYSYCGSLPSLDQMLHSAITAATATCNRSRMTMITILQEEALLSTPPYSAFTTYEGPFSSFKNANKLDENEDNSALCGLGAQEKLKVESKVSVMRMSLRVHQKLAEYQKLHIKTICSLISLILGFYFEFAIDSHNNSPMNLLQPGNNAPIEINKYGKSNPTSSLNGFIQPRTKNFNSVWEVLKMSVSKPFDTIHVSGSNANNLFDETSTPKGLDDVQRVKKLLSYHADLRAFVAPYSNWCKAILNVRTLLKYDSLLTDSSNSPNLQMTVDPHANDNKLFQTLSANFLNSVNEKLYYKPTTSSGGDTEIRVSKRVEDIAKIVAMIFDLSERFQRNTSEIQAKIGNTISSKIVSVVTDENEDDKEEGKNTSVSATVVAAAETTTPTEAEEKNEDGKEKEGEEEKQEENATEATVATADDSVTSPSEEGEKVNSRQSVIGAEFWNNHAKLERDFARIRDIANDWGFKNGYKKGVKDGISKRRIESDDISREEAEAMRRFLWFEKVVGGVTQHLFLRPEVANLSTTSDPTALLAEMGVSDTNWFSEFYDQIGDSVEFINLFNVKSHVDPISVDRARKSSNDDGSGAISSVGYSTQDYNNVMWNSLRNQRYAEQWATFDRCFRAWMELVKKHQVVLFQINKQTGELQEKVFDKNVQITFKLAGGKFSKVNKYPHPAYMFYVGGVYRRLLEKTPFFFGNRDVTLGRMEDNVTRTAIKNYFMNLKRGKQVRKYIENCIALHDWIITNLKPMLVLIFKELQKVNSTVTVGDFTSSTGGSGMMNSNGGVTPLVNTPLYETGKHEGGLTVYKLPRRQPSLLPAGQQQSSSAPVTKESVNTGGDLEDEDEEDGGATDDSSQTGIKGSFSKVRTIFRKTPSGGQESISEITTKTTTTGVPAVEAPAPQRTSTLSRSVAVPPKRQQGFLRTATAKAPLLSERTVYGLKDTPKAIYLEDMEKYINYTSVNLIPSVGMLFGPSLSEVIPPLATVMSAETGSPASLDGARINRNYVEEFLCAIAVVEFESKQAGHLVKKGRNVDAAGRTLTKGKQPQYSVDEFGEKTHFETEGYATEVGHYVLSEPSSTTTTTAAAAIVTPSIAKVSVPTTTEVAAPVPEVSKPDWEILIDTAIREGVINTPEGRAQLTLDIMGLIEDATEETAGEIISGYLEKLRKLKIKESEAARRKGK